MALPLPLLLLPLLQVIVTLPLIASQNLPLAWNGCRRTTYCGNITVSYPFSIHPGCGLAAFHDLLFCINDVLMLHLSSGSYRVLSIDYAFHYLTLHDPYMSTCHNLILPSTPTTTTTSGFVIDPSLRPLLHPSPNNVFLLLRCHADSQLFQGFPEKHLMCRNISGMGCEDYYSCPAWTSRSEAYGSVAPPECCAVGFKEMQGINLSRLGCEGYSSAYSLAPLRTSDALEWLYGIRVEYTVPLGNVSFCKACEDTGGACGYNDDEGTRKEICFCKEWNSTSNCDSVLVSKDIRWNASTTRILLGFLLCVVICL